MDSAARCHIVVSSEDLHQTGGSSNWKALRRTADGGCRATLVEARRSDGRALLELKDGAQVPVSRTYAGALRAAGWF